ncbi:MAG: sulfatase-like hydrolase/transferase [Thermoanaerobaculia bacterium]
MFSLASAHAAEPGAQRPDLLLVTLDTTRADALGCYGGGARTPNLDRIAAGGLRFAEALTPVPLTLPAHASLLTGLDPIEHGLRDNGTALLSSAIPTLTTSLSAAGYSTAAIVGSRVLDHRFGLDRGFDRYEDRMAAERLGEYGYAERTAPEVVDEALAAFAALARDRPVFLWVHFYDPHAPYRPPAGGGAASPYLGEIELVDRELGRLLAGTDRGRPRIVAAVGDHGESLGEHGEAEHGLLLTEATLRVPLLLAGPGIRAGAVEAAPVATRRLAATLLALTEVASAELPGPPLALAGGEPGPAIYHETEFPASAFGWSPLRALTAGSWRWIEGPKPHLYDLAADPGETADRRLERRDVAGRLRAELAKLSTRKAAADVGAAPRDAELSAALASLGYAAGGTRRAGTIDPRDGLALFARFTEAKRRLAAGDAASARDQLAALVRESPGSVPFWTELAAAERAAGELTRSISTLERALALNPDLEFLHLRRGDALAEAGRRDEAERALRRALAIDPRFAAAWLALAELEAKAGRPAEEERALRGAVAAGTESAGVLARLGQIELARGDLAAADPHLAAACRLLPEWPLPWELWARLAERQGRPEVAAERRSHLPPR